MLKRTLGFKISLSLLIVAILPFVGILVLFYIQARQSIKTLVEENHANLISAVGSDIERTIFSASTHVSSLVNNPTIKSPYATNEEKLYEMRKIQDFYKLFEDITLVNLDGRVLVSTTFDYRGEWSLKDWFKRARSGEAVVSPVHAILSPFRLVVIVTAPVRDPEGDIEYVLAGQVNMSAIWEITDRIRIGRTGIVFVTDNHGNIIAWPDKKMVYEKLQPDSLRETVLAAGDGAFEFHDAGGSAKLSRFSQLKGYREYAGQEWRIGIIQDVDEAYALSDYIRLRILAVAGGGTVLILLMAGLFSSNIVRPIRDLVIATGKVARGELNIKVRADSKDEIGDLGRAFNKMAEDLQQTTVSRDYVNGIFKSVADALVVVDEQGLISTVNKATLDLLHYAEEEIKGKPFKTIFADETSFVELSRHLVPEGFVGSFEAHYQRADGVGIPVLFSASLMRDPEGQPTGIVSIAKDLTELKKLEKMQRLAELGKIAAGIAHEVNNPLMIISGRAQLSLMEQIDNQEIMESLKIIVDQTTRARDIVLRVLHFSIPPKGELKGVNINKSIEEIVELVGYQFLLAGVELRTSYGEDLPPVLADERQIQEALLALLDNARQAIVGEGSIDIRTSWDQNFVRIDIVDTGCGMSEETMDRILEPFFTTRDKGAGLGLPISHSIIKEHRGQLLYESTLGKGTTTTILLPWEASRTDE